MNEKIWRKLGLTDSEYALITGQLGREPNLVELNMYSVMWSEHCSYKHSRSALRLLPGQGPRVIQGPGENAGVVDIGDGWAAVFKIESHNHPSAVEPYQGAATGVGGILRDIFTMGARPVAFLNSLRFGDLAEARSRYLLDGVVAGIGGYGNCVGIPTVGGEIYFDRCYQGNPLVNAMCVGIMPLDRLVLGRAAGPGNLVLLVGARTGRDGIHGVTFASEELGEASEEKRPAVQVGDPFMGKLLMEATLEAIEKRLVVGVQDFGGAGLTCALTETAARAGSGITIDLEKVPLREADMEPFEILTSESQERMLLIVEPDQLTALNEVFSRWELKPALLGAVTDDGMVTARFQGQVVARVPAESVAGGAPAYEPAGCEPAYLKDLQAFKLETLPQHDQVGRILLDLLSDPDLASKEAVWRRYDYMVRTCTVQGPGGDAALIRLRETDKALAMTVDGNGRYCYIDPYRGGMLAVAEATRNLSCCGAEPVGITDCLNFGNPEKEEIYWQFRRAVEGIAEACKVLEVPVVGGNVSFYNEVDGEAIYPTPVIGAVGLLEDYRSFGTLAFSRPNELVCLLGAPLVSLGGSQYLKRVDLQTAGDLAELDLKFEKILQQTLRLLIKRKLVISAHDLAEGGLAVALTESALAGNIGAEIELPGTAEVISFLFGEGPSRVLVSIARDRFAEVEQLCRAAGIPLFELGGTGGDALIIRQSGDIIMKLSLAELRKAHEEVFPCLIE